MSKVNTSKGPDPKSIRSKKRAKRGFKSIELSSRKGRRAARRLAIACSMAGKAYNPGEKATIHCGLKDWVHTAGGAINYH